MQTTLDCNTTSTVQVNVDAVRNSTLKYTEEHIDYLYETSFERSIQKQIERKLEDEENERNDILDMDAFNRTYEKDSSYKPVEYIRVGKK